MPGSGLAGVRQSPLCEMDGRYDTDPHTNRGLENKSTRRGKSGND